MAELELVKEYKLIKIYKCPVCHEPTFVEDKINRKRKCWNEDCPTNKHNLSKDITNHFTRSEFEE